MMDHRHERNNSDRNHDLPAQSDQSEPSPSTSDAPTGSYYYDDSTGYEVYEDEADREEE